MEKKLIFLLILFLLTGCAKPFYYNFDTLTNDVISAEIVEPYWTEDSIGFTILNKVDDYKLNELLNDLSKIEFEYGGTPTRPTDLALKLNYVDGYEVICNTWIVWFNSDNEAIQHEKILIHRNEFKEFLLNYTI